jgi:hypothetical protein
MSENANAAFYQPPSPTSDVARHAALVTDIAGTVPDAMAVTNNVIVHRVMARKLSLRLPASRWEDEQVRSAALRHDPHQWLRIANSSAVLSHATDPTWLI